MKMKSSLCSFALLLTCTLGMRAEDVEKSPAIEPKAVEILKRCGDFLDEMKSFAVSVEVWHDEVLDSGQKLQFTRLVDIQLRRPNRLHLEVSTAEPKRSFWYDGKTMTLLDHTGDFYGTFDAPDTLDKTVDFAEEKYGVTFPIDDLLRSKVFGEPQKTLKSAHYVDREPVLGKICHHLAFEHENVDWQLWVEDGAKSFPRKVVITYRKEDESPQYTATFGKWEINPKLPDFVFLPELPADAKKINFEKVVEEEEQAAAPKEEVKKAEPQK